MTIIEFGDFECPHCGHAEPVARELLADTDLRFVWRHLPLADVHPAAQLAAEASEAAASQGKFWEMHDLLFEHQEDLTTADLVQHAADLSLDVDRFHDDLKRHVYETRVAQDIESATSAARPEPPPSSSTDSATTEPTTWTPSQPQSPPPAPISSPPPKVLAQAVGSWDLRTERRGVATERRAIGARIRARRRSVTVVVIAALVTDSRRLVAGHRANPHASPNSLRSARIRLARPDHRVRRDTKPQLTMTNAGRAHPAEPLPRRLAQQLSRPSQPSEPEKSSWPNLGATPERAYRTPASACVAQARPTVVSK
jgi:hypothetical protein